MGVALGVTQLGVGGYITAEAARRERAQKAPGSTGVPGSRVVSSGLASGSEQESEVGGETGVAPRGMRRGIRAGSVASTDAGASGSEVAVAMGMPRALPVARPNDPAYTNAEGVLFSPPSSLGPGDGLLIRLTRSLSRHSAGGGGGATPYSPLTPTGPGLGGGGKKASTPLASSASGSAGTPVGSVVQHAGPVRKGTGSLALHQVPA